MKRGAWSVRLGSLAVVILGASAVHAIEPPPVTPPRAPAVTQPIRPVIPAAFQKPAPAPEMDARLVEPPDAARLFRLESEAALRQRMEMENQGPPAARLIVGAPFLARVATPLEFPQDPPTEKDKGTVTLEHRLLWETKWAERTAAYTCYNPLYFEDKNTERYGWDAGIFQPLLSTGKFYVDLIKLPYEIGVQAPCSCEYNTGYYLPGDPVPYYLYYPEWSMKGAALQTGTVLGLIGIVP